MCVYVRYIVRVTDLSIDATAIRSAIRGRYIPVHIYLDPTAVSNIVLRWAYLHLLCLYNCVCGCVVKEGNVGFGYSR